MPPLLALAVIAFTHEPTGQTQGQYRSRQHSYFGRINVGFENDELAGQCQDHDQNDGLRSEEHTSELQSRPHLVCRLLLEKKKKNIKNALRITPSPISSSYSSILHSTNHHISTISTIYPFTRYFINNYIILIFFQ